MNSKKTRLEKVGLGENIYLDLVPSNFYCKSLCVVVVAEFRILTVTCAVNSDVIVDPGVFNDADKYGLGSL